MKTTTVTKIFGLFSALAISALVLTSCGTSSAEVVWDYSAPVSTPELISTDISKKLFTLPMADAGEIIPTTATSVRTES